MSLLNWNIQNTPINEPINGIYHCYEDRPSKINNTRVKFHLIINFIPKEVIENNLVFVYWLLDVKDFTIFKLLHAIASSHNDDKFNKIDALEKSNALESEVTTFNQDRDIVSFETLHSTGLKTYTAKISDSSLELTVHNKNFFFNTTSLLFDDAKLQKLS